MRRRFLGACAAGSFTLLLAVAGCANSDGGSQIASVGGTASPQAEQSDGASGLSNQEKALKFAECMRENGIDMEDPEPGGGVGVRMKVNAANKEKLEAAQKACEQYSPFGDKGPNVNPQANENMRKFAKCMRDNGVEDFPDPDDGGVRIEKSITDDPDFTEAQEKCEKLHMPGGKAGTKVTP